MANEVEIVVKGKDQTSAAFKASEKSARDLGSGFDAAGEKADASEQRILGLKDTVDGAATIMKGPGQQGIAAYLQGWADLASGMFQFIIPALKLVTVNILKTTASMVTSSAQQVRAWIVLAAQAMANAVRIAAAWLISLGPIGLVIAAIGGAIAIVVLLWKKFEGFRDFIKNIGVWFAGPVVLAVKAVTMAAKAVSGIWHKLTGDTKENVAKQMEEAAKLKKAWQTTLEEMTADWVSATDSFSDISQTYQDALDDNTEKVRASMRKSGRAVEGFEDKVRVSMRDILRSMENNARDWRNHVRNVERLAPRIPRALLDELIKAGPKASSLIAKLANSSDRELNKYVDLWGQAGSDARQQFLSRIQAQSLFNEISARIFISLGARPRGRAHGGIIGAEGGGIRGGLVEVGEHGRELVRLPTGSTVIPNGTTEAMLAGAGGGRIQKILLQFGASDDLMRAVVEGLRKHIRAQGGNVQAVLGR